MRKHITNQQTEIVDSVEREKGVISHKASNSNEKPIRIIEQY